MLENSGSGPADRTKTTEDIAECHALLIRLRDYARQRSALDAAEAFDLVRAERLRLSAIAGYASHYEYMERVLGYRPHAARERMRVARALVGLPRMMAELSRGALRFSAVRELTRVATPDTEVSWVEAAADKSVHEIELLVAGHAPGDLPEDPTVPDLRLRNVHLKLTTDVMALWRQARLAIATELGGEVTDETFVETMCRRVLDPGTGADGPAHQIAYKQCPDCRRATQNGAGRELDIAPAALERAACDARHLGSLDAPSPQRATTTITSRLREQLFARDNHRCTVPGCRSARNLDVHHIIEQAAGGPHTLWNCTLLCSGHHAALHAGLLSAHGEAPHRLQFRWTFGPPVPVDADEATRTAMRDSWFDAHMRRVEMKERIESGELDIAPHDVPRGTRGEGPPVSADLDPASQFDDDLCRLEMTEFIESELEPATQRPTWDTR